ncbi:MAG TPA: glycosyltransferase, partial [Gemmataceae bacterium]|nr:glycosyltransferase [Gemmataceae bacterium]
MRVAILSHQAPAGDAIGNGIADKAAFFVDRNAQVRLFVEVTRPIHPRLRPLAHGITGADASRDALAFMADADLLLVEYGQYYPALNLLPLLAGRKPRIILDYHGVTPPELWTHHNREALLFGWQRRGIAWCADRVVVHSQFAAEELRTACRYPQERTFVVPHHAGGALVSQGTKTPPNIRAELGLQDCKIILFVGRMAPNKRLGVLIGALARLSHLEPPVHLLLVGNTQDLYRQELERCLELARTLKIGDRIHVLGQVDDQRLQACYAAADLFVMPSVHEGFCIPVLEAMAQNVPVVAAHAGALPETVGDAGLLFTPDDDTELAERVRTILNVRPASRRTTDSSIRRRPRVAVVCFRFGSAVVGGAEKSLALMAASLQDAGASVEVFTTCTVREHGWENDLHAGSSREDGMLTHRFPVDPLHQVRHNAIVRRVLEEDGRVDAEGEQEFIRQSIHSTALMAELAKRIDEFDVVLTGPYLAGLTYDVCRIFPEKTLLAGCFHDEAVMRLKIWQKVYRQVGGILYHSVAEKKFAERAIGLNHPRSAVIGTWLDLDRRGNPVRGHELAGSTSYVVYCGRYSPQKNLPLLLDWFRGFNQRYPGKLSLVLAGQGSVSIPTESWCRDLGFVDDQAKADLLAGARAVVHLSVHESLSLVALEAWANGTPVIAHQGCAVLADLIKASGGGTTVGENGSFERALLDLLERPQHWQAVGQNARAYVVEQYGSRARFTERLLDA